MTAKVVERTGPDQRLEDALVAHAEVDLLAQCVERGDRPFLARGEDRVDGGPPDAAVAITGAPGTVAGMTTVDSAEFGPVPTALVAATWNW